MKKKRKLFLLTCQAQLQLNMEIGGAQASVHPGIFLEPKNKSSEALKMVICESCVKLGNRIRPLPNHLCPIIFPFCHSMILLFASTQQPTFLTLPLIPIAYPFLQPTLLTPLIPIA